MGFIKPVILIEPTEILGANVSRVSGFNYEHIKNSKIGKNSIVGVVRSGDVIPYVTEVFEESKTEDIVIPKYCPTCDTKLEIISKELMCINPKCKYKNIQKVSHFFISMGCEGMSDKTIENLGITSIEEMYSLTQNFVEKLPGFGEKKAEKILFEVQKTLKVKPEMLIEAFGIPLIGKTLAKKLCKKFTFDQLFEIKDLDELGFGEITSRIFIDTIQIYKPLYLFLKSKGLEFEEKEIKEDNLKDFSFELTGKGPLGRDEIKLLIESRGGEVKSISKNTNYLVTNEINSKSSKMKKAEKLSIPIITYDKLFEDFLC
jgi:DNA ligase (NAD+)